MLKWVDKVVPKKEVVTDHLQLSEYHKYQSVDCSARFACASEHGWIKRVLAVDKNWDDRQRAPRLAADMADSFCMVAIPER